MSNPEDYAFASEWQKGLTKREYFAGLFLQGLLSNPNFNGGEELNTVAEKVLSALYHADTLLEQLEEKKGGGDGK